MTEKRLIFGLIVLFALSAAYLFSVNERGLDPNTGKNWWSLSFAEPKNAASLDFVVSNHTTTADFRYTISADDQTLATGVFVVEPGNDMTHVPSIPFMPVSGRITITVSHDGRDETIYRSL
ncbi:MAG: hypothetical protein IPJ68_02115 [Candidatus Moraniibacteriota bacterium]|nr:MAG: hypothetical protein IPJ68_02115 [Candidatus Moranbacteria bacterium]